MAAAYQADTQSLDIVSASTTTFSHTASGTDRAMVCFVALSGISETVSSITYNGTNLAVIGTKNNSGTVDAPSRIEAWGLAPSTSGSVVVTLSAANAAWDVSAVSFTGANQTGGASTFNGFTSGGTAGASASSVALTIPSTSGDCVVTCGLNVYTGNCTTPVGATQQFVNTSGATNIQGSTQVSSGSSVSVTERWDISAFDFCALGLNVSQVAAGTPTLVQAHYRWRNDDGTLVGPVY